jgi:uncharacterized protein (UPF0276 family)
MLMTEHAAPIESAPIKSTPPKVGVGLRHPHYEQALTNAADIDFVEVHTENFIMDGGANLALLERARELYDLSFHCTALGLGSAAGLSGQALAKLAELVERFDPLLVSDHLCFCWVNLDGRRMHAGDLLPVQRTRESLAVLASNVDRVQQAIGRPLLVENVTAYINEPAQDYSETEFLCRLVERTGCGLLVDINNLLVNAHNLDCPSPADYAMAWLDQIPPEAVGEIHLAGYTPVPRGEIAVDDHAAPVSALGWQVYEYALEHLSDVPTLVEWDTALPEWSELQAEALYARRIAQAAASVGV